MYVREYSHGACGRHGRWCHCGDRDAGRCTQRDGDERAAEFGG